MPYCSRCNREHESNRWEFCPRCGTRLAEPLQGLVQGKLTKQFSSANQVVSPAKSEVESGSEEWPSWYQASVKPEEQPADAMTRETALALQQAQMMEHKRDAEKRSQIDFDILRDAAKRPPVNWS